MRVAHVTATFPPYYGGTGAVCYHNAVGLARLGHEVTVVTAEPAIGVRHLGYADPPEIVVRRLPVLWRVGNAPIVQGLGSALEGYDLVHLHYPFYFGAEVVYLRALMHGLRYVVTYHQDVLLAGALRYPEAAHHALLGRRILARAGTVMCTSLDYARASRLRELMRTSAGLVDELPNGVDLTRFRPGLGSGAQVSGGAVAPDALRARYGLQEADRVMLFVGGLDRAHYFKGVGVLLRAMARLPEDRLKLLLVGDGDLRPAYEKQARALGQGDRVRFCGRVSDAELPAHYALSDLVVLPSTTMGEAFGVVLLEGMACGKPVVASNLPGVRTVVQDGEDGLLARAGDAEDLAAKLALLLEDPARCRAMGARGRAKVEARYAWPRIIEQLVGVYERVLEAPTPRS